MLCAGGFFRENENERQKPPGSCARLHFPPLLSDRLRLAPNRPVSGGICGEMKSLGMVLFVYRLKARLEMPEYGRLPCDAVAVLYVLGLVLYIYQRLRYEVKM